MDRKVLQPGTKFHLTSKQEPVTGEERQNSVPWFSKMNEWTAPGAPLAS